MVEFFAKDHHSIGDEGERKEPKEVLKVSEVTASSYVMCKILMVIF